MKTYKLLLIVIFLLICHQITYSQQGQWTWISGDSTYNSHGTFGTKGVPSINNTPPGIYEACQWTDLQGDFWLYGGVIYPFNFFKGISNDLWKFNPLTKEWTWIRGDSTFSLPIYGTLGVPSINNSPGDRGFGAATWTDSIGDLWLFGGSGDSMSMSPGTHYSFDYNDLWRYHIATNEWTWMGGSNLPNQTGVYGTIGVASTLNNPSARHETNCTWTTGNNLWLFGGYCYGTDNVLWKYNILNNEWIWINGSITNPSTVYGIKGIENPANTPGKRYVYCSWKSNSNYLWLFAGLNNLGNNLNDVWRYNIISNKWSWQSGTNIANDTGSYNVYCNSSINFYPSARFENRSCWTDICGNLWTYGGFPNTNLNPLNDLWHFNSTTKNWTLVSGNKLTNQIGFYGTKTIPSTSNIPACRGGAISWSDLQGNLWLFGGLTNNFHYKNDLWCFIPDTTCPAINCSVITTMYDSIYICLGDTTLLSTIAGQSYLWNTGDTTSNLSVHPLNTTVYTVHINQQVGYSTIDSITVYVINKPIINLGNDTTLCQGQTIILNSISPNSTYLWQNGSTNSSLNVNQQGIYWLKVTNQNNCFNYDTINVTYNPLPLLNLGNDTALCQGQTIVLNATNPNSTYQWQNSSINSTFIVSQQGIYWVKVTNQYNCSVYDSINVNYNPVYNIIVNKTICQGQTYQIGTHSYTTSGTYIDTLTTLNYGCDSIITTNLTVNPSYNIVVNKTICQDQTYQVGTQIYTTTGTYIDTLATSSGCDSIVTTNLIVNPNQQTILNPLICQGETYYENTHPYTTTGTYNDTLTTYLGCDSIVTINLIAVPLPTVNLGNDTILCNGKLIILNATNASSTYFWQDSTTNPTYNVSQAGIYWVTVTDNNNCISSDTINIIFQECIIPDIYIPNSFTPNGDGLNDVFNIKTTYEFRESKLVIYDRWGEMIFESDDINKGWGGTYKGKAVPLDVYIYQLTATMKDTGEQIKKTGRVTVVR